MKPEDDLAPLFKALGDPTRLAIFACLRDCCADAALDDDGSLRPADGATVGQVCCRITGAEKITSTLSAHIKELRLAGLVRTERRGKHVVCSIDPDAVARLAAFFDHAKEKTRGCC